jgi:DNA polymerase I-like protein with 3'-5' exonuclease and polymerase domains
MISVDTEVTGLDLYHSARPFFFTSCDEDGEQIYYEWEVNPFTREVTIPEEDAREIRQLLARQHDGIVLHNSKFDATALRVAGVTDWSPLWELTHDTLLAGHLLASNQPHDLTSMAISYIGIDIEPYELALKNVCTEARRFAKSRFPEWKIAKEGRSGMPSAKGSCWRYDYWLPRKLARELGYPDDHLWHTVLRDYANADSATTIALWKVLEGEMKRKGLWEIYLAGRIMPQILHEMEWKGVTISKKQLRTQQKEYGEESEKANKVCVEIAKEYNYDLELPKSGNNKSLTAFLFNILELPPIKSSEKTGAPSLDKEVLEHYEAVLPEGDQLNFIRALRGKRKRDTGLSYLESYERYWLPLQGRFQKVYINTRECNEPITVETGKAIGNLMEAAFKRLTQELSLDIDWHLLHPSINPTGTATLRMSSQNPNEQNISKQEGFNLRACFGPAPGREWWSLDAKNIERRIPAYEAGEEEIIQLFEKPNNPPYYGSEHLLVGHILFPKEFESCRDEKGGIDGRIFKERYKATLYQWTKNTNFAIQYGCQEAKADATAHVRGAYYRIKSRFQKQEELNQYWIKFANKHGYVETIPDKTLTTKGCKRGYPLLCSRATWGGISPTIPLNYHVQGTAMWWMRRAMIRCFTELKKWQKEEGFDAHLIMQIHDELLFDLPYKPTINKVPGNLHRVKRLQKLMEMGGEDIGIPTPCGISYHRTNWAKEEVFA